MALRSLPLHTIIPPALLCVLLFLLMWFAMFHTYEGIARSGVVDMPIPSAYQNETKGGTAIITSVTLPEPIITSTTIVTQTQNQDATTTSPSPASTSTTLNKSPTATPSPRPPRILLVSAFFPLPDSQTKHSTDDYRYWLSKFLGPAGVQTDIYFYTTPEMADVVRSLHPSSSDQNDHARLTINTTYLTPFSVPPLAPFKTKYEEMHAWDREKARHSPELYAVWNAKPWLLEQAVAVAYVHDDDKDRQYDYAFWCDAGSFRAPHPFRAWPDPGRVQNILDSSESTVKGVDEKDGEGVVKDGEDRVFFALCQLPGWKEYWWNVGKGPVDMDFSEGSFFGSTPSGISWFAHTFYETHNMYITTSPSSPLSNTSVSPPSGSEPGHPHTSGYPPFYFVGKDQTLINSILFRFPERFMGVMGTQRMHLLPHSAFPPSYSHLSSSSPNASTTTTTATTSTHHTPPPPPSTYPYIFTPSYILSSLAYKISPLISHIPSLRSFLPPRIKCGDWWYYQWWLASDAERETAGKEDVEEWAGCWETPALRVEKLVWGMFGKGWKP